MKFRLFFQILLLALPTALFGQVEDAMQKGDAALAAGLWEMASLHYGEVLATAKPGSEERSRAAVRMAESMIREGKPAEAFELLGQSFVGGDPETPFWKSMAMVELGRFSEARAALILMLENPALPHRVEAVLTLANIELALDSPDSALATLASLGKSEDPSLIARSRLLQVEILIDLDRHAEARAMMPAGAEISPADRPLATFLEAHLLMGEGKLAEATAIFTSLVDQAQGQSLHRYHSAAVALVDSLLGSSKTDDAATFLLTFIQEHPESPQLDALFERLLEVLPATPARTDPILERLSQWITPSEIPATGLVPISGADSVAAWPPLPGVRDELLAHAIHTRALGLRRVGTPESTAEARRLLTRLRIDFPQHPLASRALFEQARSSLAEGAVDRAFGMLETLRETAQSPGLQGKAAFLEAESSYLRGDTANASLLFDEAAASLSGQESRAARLNAAIIRLAATTKENKPTAQKEVPEDKSLAADLELERALSKTDALEKRTAIEEFLTRHPDHPRVAEARLAAAECALTGTNPDLSFARAQLETLASDTDTSSAIQPSRVALVRLRIEDLAGDSAAAIATAKTILEQYPGDPAAPEAALTLGRNLFEASSYNDARLVLEKLAASDTDPGRAQAAWLLAARSAALVPTNQSQGEALILFDKVIESKGPLSSIAKLEKARLMIDMNRLDEAAVFLKKWFAELPVKDPLHLPAGLLLGEAVYAQGSVQSDSLSEALAVYDKLLAEADKHPALFNRLQYLRGRTLEQIPDATDPSRKRERQAFIAYYSVLETTEPPVEWHYFELCGFRALALLEKAGRWPAAIACAKKIASFKGPRAEEAASRAAQLQLKHMIWED